ncbi:group I truncated hemoglobin [Thermoflavimicrobium daqui]|uniref:Group 1 truncated hemoglobin n=1 Tax=Thermoflavimicrobium daqui TaxID=2137476 RepID=A0A364K7X7_9BACL|nr:group 1 truncated hemoglobin [Thermoflavimicrobium daqui]RAL26394.1 group 1 truncated hemoglobin [Thermoflavimicrobium daqui]
MTRSSTKGTLFNQLGGISTVETVVAEFYDRLLVDDQLSHLFVNVDLDVLQKHFTSFFVTFFLNGPASYSGKTLRMAHKGLQITSEEYNIALKHLRRVLFKYKVSIEIVAKLEANLLAVKPHIVNK